MSKAIVEASNLEERFDPWAAEGFGVARVDLEDKAPDSEEDEYMKEELFISVLLTVGDRLWVWA